MTLQPGDKIDNFTLEKIVGDYAEPKLNQTWEGIINGTNIACSIIIFRNEIRNMIIKKDQSIIIDEKKYLIGEQIGCGTFGFVYDVYSEDTLDNYALKIFQCPEEAVQEYKFYKKLDGCPSLPKIISYSDTALNNLILMERLEGNINGLELTFKESCKILKDILLALDFIHDKNLVHGDIKSTNILYDKDKNGYLCDFTNMYYKNTFVNEICTVWFRSPENCSKINKNEKGYLIDFSADIWALGICFLAMINRGLTPSFFKVDNPLFLFFRISNQIKIDEIIDFLFEEFKEEEEMNLLVKNMMKISPEERISAKKALEYF